jgi:hypothetical protein
VARQAGGGGGVAAGAQGLGFLRALCELRSYMQVTARG